MTAQLQPEEVEAEARRLVGVAAAAGVEMRLLGGLAVRAHCAPGALGPTRTYSDIDVVTDSGLAAVEPVMREARYEPFTRFNALHGHSRAIFYSDEERLKVDVFLGSFSMCHTVPLRGRLDADTPTVPLAELLLTKLQIVELNEKDMLDLGALLAEHPVGSGDEETIDGDRVAAICSADWGLEHTIERNLERLGGEISRLRGADADVVRERIERLREQIASHPKTRKWRMRALVGERMPWFEEPDEVADEH